MKFTMAMLSLLAVASQVAASPIPEADEAITDYGIPSFTANFGPNGEEMTVNGTIEEVIAQVAEINPAFNWGPPPDAISLHARVDTGPPDTSKAWPNAKPSDYLDVRDLKCDKSLFTAADVGRLNEGLYYLRTMPGKFHLKKGHRCHRVSCSWNAAIFQCFEPRKGDKQELTASWKYLGDIAHVIRDYCKFKDGFDTYVRGKLWAYSGLAVEIKKEEC